MNASLQLIGVSAERPFPGLRPFAYQDHDYFFGREDQTFALYRLIDRFRFIAVVGSSGSGKSSLVRAGLLPLLDTETREPGGRSWLWREMRPGDAPLLRLTNLLASLTHDDDPVVASGRRDRIAAQLQRSSFGISEALAEMKDVTDKSLVLVIDQFEELFRYATPTVASSSSGDAVRARDEATQFVQLLLEASRAPALKIHVMLTMRSDFIGDCARFHGLPEAVSAAQFLVPSLTRDQLDEVIRKPVEKAGATIDPELIERLLNDCGTELDQLPVLQHCLSRLWEEAGKAPETTVAPAGTIPPAHQLGAVATRRLSMSQYRAIGQFADALSQHADAILKDLPGARLELAVKQVFSALSELDKEGRAIRRALKFSQLVAETGVDEKYVRQVLDRFRADDCSFLTPPASDVKEIIGDTRIDVGHEALLRRWEKVSGYGAELGWLRAEQQAGERYRGLLAMAEGDNAALPSHLVDERLAWWNARPRTAAWAERYGGGFERVKRLLQVSQSRRRRKRAGIAAAFAVALGTAAVMAWLYWTATTARLEATANLQQAVEAQLQAERAQADADRRRTAALQTTKTSIGRLAGFLNDGTLTAIGAKQFLADARATLEDMANTEGRSPDISEVEMSLLLTVSDVNISIGNFDDALALAQRVENVLPQLVKQFPGNASIEHLVFACKFRLGDELARRHNNDEAETKYREAFAVAQHLKSIDPGNAERQHDELFIRNKIGDLFTFKKQWQQAMDEYKAGLLIAPAIADTFPSDLATQKNRIAQLLSDRREPGDKEAALAEYREALAIQQQLLTKTPDDATLLSNIALTHRRLGGLLQDRPDEAQIEYVAAIANRKRLYESDPGNVAWRVGLMTDYRYLGDVLTKKDDWRAASQYYSLAIQFGEGLVLKDPTNLTWQRLFAIANTKHGDALIRRKSDAQLRPEPAIDQASRALARYQAAEKAFKTAATDPRDGAAQYANLFDVQVKIGDILVGQYKFRDAADAYQAASATIAQAPSAARAVDWQIRLSTALEEAGDFLAYQAGADTSTYQLAGTIGEATLAFYQNALDAIEAAIDGRDNHDLQLKKTALVAKIATERASPR